LARVPATRNYYDDPAAPAANRIVPSANVIVVHDASERLLIHSTDIDNRSLPGGAQDLRESLPHAAVRVTLKTTGA